MALTKEQSLRQAIDRENAMLVNLQLNMLHRLQQEMLHRDRRKYLD